MVGSFERGPLRTAALVAVLASGMLAAGPARAQFFFWDQPRYSADDVARLAMQHGFRPLAKPARQDDVYLADVVDQRGRRERLVISVDSGEILQRFFIDQDRGYRRYADPTIPRGPLPPGRVPDDDNRSLMSRLTPDNRELDGAAPDDFTEPRPVPRPPRVRKPRVATQPPETVHQQPVESAPLAPSAPAPAPLKTPAPAAAPAEAALPPPAATPPQANPEPATPPVDKPGRSISHDPLAIPGSREHDEAQAAATKAAEKKPAAPPAVKAAVPAVVKPAVPVAPLE